MLWNDNHSKILMIHRLVAKAFVPNPHNLPQVNHKDENKDNNNADNLEWCTATYNLNYGTHNEMVSKSNINNPKISRKVLQFDLDGRFLKEWESTMEIQRQLGFPSTHISACCLGKKYHKTSGGYIWRYAE